MTYYANVFEDSRIDNFKQFIYCLNEYKSNRFCPDLLLSYLVKYYGGYKELIENFSVDEVSQLISTLCTNQGVPMFKSAAINTLIEAREFALSDDPNKIIEYLCTIEFEFRGENSDKPVKIEGTVTVNCISNKYLKLLENEDASYEDYLLEVAQDQFTQKYPLLAEFMYQYQDEQREYSYRLAEYQPTDSICIKTFEDDV